ncbi:MAG: hypothetical protein AB8G99_12510, partial [Planctomycetaceae bacterium]
AADQAKLQELDNLFRSIIRKPIAQWNFAQLESGYMNLKQNASHPSIANKVDMRLPALKRELKRKRRYDDFATLASATAQRDRQLAQMASGTTGAAPPATEILPAPPRGTPSVYSASMPGGTEPPMNGPGLRVPPALPEPSPTPPPGNVPRPPEPAPAGNGNGGQSFPAPRMAGTVPIVPEQKQPIAGNPNRKAGPASPVFDPRQQPVEVDREPVPPGMTRVPRRHPKYVGAGIIMRSTELDVPKYVLLAPTGKILAYLEAVGSFDLERHVNFAMGVKGDRFNNPKWNADLIKVRDLETISLKQ